MDGHEQDAPNNIIPLPTRDVPATDREVPAVEVGTDVVAVEVAAEPQDPATLLTELADAFAAHVYLPDGAPSALALFSMHTWVHEQFDYTPRLVLTSPVKRCGKTLVLDLLRQVVARPRLSANITAATFFRLVDAEKPTLLIDEADTFVAKRDDLLGVLNAGFRADGAVQRMGKHGPEDFKCFAPVAIAAIDKLAGTIMDRAIVIPMERKPGRVTVERLDREARQRLVALRPRLLRWAKDNPSLGTLRPVLPDCLNDRQRDILEPLLAIAQSAGQQWEARAREAVEHLCRALPQDDPDVAERLLSAVGSLFAQKPDERQIELPCVGQVDFLPLSTVVARLLQDEAGGWHAVPPSGRRLTTHALGSLLRRFGLRPRQTRRGEPGRQRGYHREDVDAVVEKYLGPARAP